MALCFTRKNSESNSGIGMALKLFSFLILLLAAGCRTEDGTRKLPHYKFCLAGLGYCCNKYDHVEKMLLECGPDKDIMILNAANVYRIKI